MRTPRLLVVTTWDGFVPLSADVARIGALVLAEAPAAERSETSGDPPYTVWEGLAADLRRASVHLVRIGDLKPSALGERAAVVHDPRGLVDQWIRWSRGRDRARERPAAESRDRLVLDAEEAVRGARELPRGAQAVRGGEFRAIAPGIAASLREARARLDPSRRVEAALIRALDDELSAMPHAGSGYRLSPLRGAESATRESFLRVADGEGFLGDRMLFDAAEKRLGELSRRAPVFDEGFVVPTFDAVEMRWRFGEGTRRGGERRPPLIPCVHVGVGVTPADALEFWAGPAFRVEPASVACVHDRGTRVVRERTVGKDALLAAILEETERAWRELPAFLRAARRAGRTPAPDVEAALRPLHLPRSYREAAKRVANPDDAKRTRLGVALALARVGTGEDPLNARKMGLAAGRLVAATPA